AALPEVIHELGGLGHCSVKRRDLVGRKRVRIGMASRQRRPAGGTSVIEIGPYAERFHPARNSQVWAAATVRISGGGMPTFQDASSQPSNHHADENGSMPPKRGSIDSPWRRAFWST